MTREMYERAIARMRDVGQVIKHTWAAEDGILIDSATVVWKGRIEEATEVIRKWGKLVCETGGFLNVHIFRSSLLPNAYEIAKVEWVVHTLSATMLPRKRSSDALADLPSASRTAP